MTERSALLIELQRPDSTWVEVGVLYSFEETNWFEFDSEYWGLRSRPVLGQVFEEHAYTWKPHARVALPYWFSHLLPEGRLRRAVAVASRINSKREFELIRRLGVSDLPGAVRATPRAIDGDAKVPVPEKETSEEPLDPVLKFSLSGVQLKFSVIGSHSGLVVPARGSAGNHILKFPDERPGVSGVPEAELGCLSLARLCGINAPAAFLVEPREVEGLEEWSDRVTGRALAVRRFDRKDDGQRIHMEELAQVLDIPTANTNAKYDRANFEVVATVLAGLAGVEVVGEVIDRIVLNIAVGNGDAHLKNWAVVYPDGLHPELSPVYDVVPTVLFMDDEDLGLKLDDTRVFGRYRPDSFESLGERSGFGRSEAVERAGAVAARIRENWTVLQEYLGRENYSRLTARLETLPIMRDV